MQWEARMRREERPGVPMSWPQLSTHEQRTTDTAKGAFMYSTDRTAYFKKVFAPLRLFIEFSEKSRVKHEACSVFPTFTIIDSGLEIAFLILRLNWFASRRVHLHVYLQIS